MYRARGGEHSGRRATNCSQDPSSLDCKTRASNAGHPSSDCKAPAQGLRSTRAESRSPRSECGASELGFRGPREGITEH
eukprot:3746453-Alexandrium_andersonii.AAC.1